MEASRSFSVEGESQLRPEKIKRGYRACLHCRSRKAKCDLGDIDAPSSPPCSRCKRESRECVFAPSRRGGNNRKRNRKGSLDESDVDTKGEEDRDQLSGNQLHLPNSTNQTFPYPYPPDSHHTLPQPSGSHDSRPSPHATYPYHGPNTGSSGANLSPMTGTSVHTPPARPMYGPAASSSRNAQQPSSTPSPKRRRLHLNPPLHAADPSSIVVADMQNESDALQILALASGQAATKESIVGGRGKRNQETYLHEKSGQAATVRDISNFKRFYDRRKSDEAPALEDFPLIKLGILNVDQAVRLVDRYFRYYHHLTPICPSAVIPTSKEDLAVYAQKERYSITTFIIIASRLDDTPGSRDIHNKSWEVMRGWIADVQTLGAPPTVGFVESILLLAENPPRPSPLASPVELNAVGAREEPHGDENRQGWQLIGLAVRSAYELGLDKMALRLLPDSERTLEIERARVAWTYCYLSDRHVSIRLGKGFWARGAAVCFQGFSSSSQSGPAAGYGNFPFLREIPDDQEHPQEDYGSLLQAYLELTQLMSNAHDTLYPNAARTRSLVIHGEYFKYLDEMARSLDAFKLLWVRKQWKMFPLVDIMWTFFYYTQLYICAFSFQAHVERATVRAEEEYRALQRQTQQKGTTTIPKLSLFPRGAAQSPDARYIFHMCDAAREMLHICVNKLYPGGALPFLPTRHLLWFTYAAIVLLKALYSGAMLRGDHQRTNELIDKLCHCLSQTSTESDYPAVRYGRQLEALRQKLAGLSDAVNTRSPTGGVEVPLPPIRRPSISQWEGNDTYRNEPSGHQNAPARQEQSDPPNHHNGYNDTNAWRQHSIQNQPPTQHMEYVVPEAREPIPPLSNLPPYMPTANPLNTMPYTQQPISDIGGTQASLPKTFSGGNVGEPDFTLNSSSSYGPTDNWFGFVGLGNNWQAEVGNRQEPGFGQVAGLDLDDFFLQVGPGEGQGGFPFR
ncbi:uncharacterized protein I206_106120 [Kwoniella pini CBS 10737]|uniref:Zn(2)-C6 fungal-type domain-containing protein n=1 Tax=Kwoniella pini CBS 10737 TaxID=1296096 RepID=A0A1B9I134_9TREE|nr:uncharacterized protein I206_04944 [Kwoniella pini CBS 10737]OCF49256.1 hypothetical protein I206_04944 [Kwoniella pini CBS 10737]